MEEGELMDKKYSGYEDNDCDDMFSDTSSTEYKFPTPENEEDYSDSMQNQPEAKTKGIIMALAGIVMTALKSILSGLGVIA